MTELAVALYGDEGVENPKGIPGVWPAAVLEISDGAPLPDGYSRRFTPSGLEAYKAEHYPTWLAWRQGYTPTPTFATAGGKSLFYTANISVTVDIEDKKVPYNTAMFQSPLFQLQVTGEVVVSEDCYGYIEATVTAENDKNSVATECEVWIAVNGFPIAGTMSILSCLKQNVGASAHSIAITDLAAGDVVSAVIRRVSGSGQVKTVFNGCRLAICAEVP